MHSKVVTKCAHDFAELSDAASVLNTSWRTWAKMEVAYKDSARRLKSWRALSECAC